MYKNIYADLYENLITHNKVTVALEFPPDLTSPQRDGIRRVFNSMNHVYTWEDDHLIFQSEQRRPRSERLKKDSIRFGLYDLKKLDDAWVYNFIFQYPKTFSSPKSVLRFYLERFIGGMEWENVYFRDGEFEKDGDSSYSVTLSFKKKRKRSEDEDEYESSMPTSRPRNLQLLKL